MKQIPFRHCFSCIPQFWCVLFLSGKIAFNFPFCPVIWTMDYSEEFHLISKYWGIYRFLFFTLFFGFYLFLECGKEGKETLVCERNINWLPLAGSNWGPGPQARHVPWPGIEPVTFWFTGQRQSTQPHQPGPFTYF